MAIFRLHHHFIGLLLLLNAITLSAMHVVPFGFHYFPSNYHIRTVFLFLSLGFPSISRRFWILGIPATLDVRYWASVKFCASDTRFSRTWTINVWKSSAHERSRETVHNLVKRLFGNSLVYHDWLTRTHVEFGDVITAYPWPSLKDLETMPQMTVTCSHPQMNNALCAWLRLYSGTDLLTSSWTSTPLKLQTLLPASYFDPLTEPFYLDPFSSVYNSATLNSWTKSLYCN